MMTDAELEAIAKRNPAGVESCQDAAWLVEEMRWMRTMMRTISGQEILVRPGTDILEVQKRLTAAITVARTALGLPASGEHGVLAQTSGPAANNAAQEPVKKAQTGLPGTKPGGAGAKPPKAHKPA
jgi:hypothetical protein